MPRSLHPFHCGNGFRCVNSPFVHRSVKIKEKIFSFAHTIRLPFINILSRKSSVSGSRMGESGSRAVRFRGGHCRVSFCFLSFRFPLREERTSPAAVAVDHFIKVFARPTEVFRKAIPTKKFFRLPIDQFPMRADVPSVESLPTAKADHFVTSLQRKSRAPCGSTVKSKESHRKGCSSPLQSSFATNFLPQLVVIPISSNPNTNR